ncbi:methylated-DNA--[protein]-cysteine S-methyltransferase [Aeromicrobium halocynthiae]|uniref:Methylated-DNA--protein-cysteine methyltransferase n=1 Tax=Aeromicrobium halocynthiae TaxID=560557 RepID=A0ABN2VXW8_9ACTN
MSSTRWTDSPIGGLRLHAHAGLLTRVEFGAEPSGDRAEDAVLDAAEQQLQEYFAGVRREFDLPLASDGTEFQRKVWSEVRRIPYGETASYGDIARRLGYEPGISRAVGAANGANPLPVVVPCHRVVGSDGSLTGYAGGPDRKRILLELERPGLF